MNVEKIKIKDYHSLSNRCVKCRHVQLMCRSYMQHAFTRLVCKSRKNSIQFELFR